MNLLGITISLLATKHNTISSSVSPRRSSAALTTTPTTDVATTTSNSTLKLHNKNLKWCLQNDAAILIDLENVRGKAFFHLSHREMLKRITLWTKLYNLETKVSIIVDHGSEQCGYYLPDGGIGIIFAGSYLKADDILARDVGSFQKNVAVVTSDNGLIARCESTMNKVHACNTNSVHFMKPIDFLSDLERLTSRLETEKVRLDKDRFRHGNGLNPNGNTGRPTRKRSRSQLLWTHLALKELGEVNLDGIKVLQKAVTYDRQFEDDEVLEWEEDRKKSPCREKTTDREFLSERFRHQVERVSIEQNEAANCVSNSKAEFENNPSLAYTMRIETNDHLEP